MIARFNGNVVPFADDATLTNRTVFGGVTQSDAIDDNLNTNFKKGWEIVGLNDNPTREDFNAMGYTLSALTAYLYEMGISEWNASQNYRVNSRVIGSNGKIYKAKTGTDLAPNVNNNPTTDTTNWEIDTQFDINSLTAKTTPIDSDNLAIQESGGLLKKISWANIKAALNLLYVGLTGNQTIAGVKTFSSSPIVPNPTTGTQASNKSYVDELYNLDVHLTGNQTIAGVKTFSSSPIVPTPINNGDAVNKEYVDNNGAILQVVYAENKVVGTGSLTIPADGTIPQITEGNEILTCTITPKKANSRLLIEFTPSTQEVSDNGNVQIVACFRTGVSNALYQTASNAGTPNGITENAITGRFIIDTPTTSPITFSLRAGLPSGSIGWNQINYSTLYMKTSTTMTIMEIAQ